MVFGLQRYTLFFITENIILIIIVIDCFTNKYFFTRGGNLLNIFFFTIVVVVENLDVLICKKTLSLRCEKIITMLVGQHRDVVQKTS